MWPFKKKQKLPSAANLTRAEVAWLQRQRDAIPTLAAAVAATPAPADPVEAADTLIRAWHALPESCRPDANEIVNVAAVALGDALAAKLGLEWKIITDAFGTDLGLWWTNGRGNIVLAPTHSVAKKFAGNPDGFVAALLKVMILDVGKLRENIEAQ